MAAYQWRDCAGGLDIQPRESPKTSNDDCNVHLNKVAQRGAQINFRQTVTISGNGRETSGEFLASGAFRMDQPEATHRAERFKMGNASRQFNHSYLEPDRSI